MRRALLAAACLAALVQPAAADQRGRFLGHGLGGYNDGFAGSPGGTFQRASFASYAAQSGQTFTKTPSWRRAGVEYPVGALPGTTWLDPATASLPSGCAYSATGSLSGSPQVTCTGAGPFTFTGYDFSGTLVGSHGAVILKFGSGVSGAVTITNNTLALDNAANTGANAALIYFSNPSPTVDLDVEDNTFDGNAPAAAGMDGLIVVAPGSGYSGPTSASPATITDTVQGNVSGQTCIHPAVSAYQSGGAIVAHVTVTGQNCTGTAVFPLAGTFTGGSGGSIAPLPTGPMNFISLNQVNSITMRRNAFLRVPSRIESGGTILSGNITVAWNYIDGMTYPGFLGSNVPHGELIYNNYTSGVGSQIYRGNTVVFPKYMLAGGSNAPWYISNGGIGALTIPYTEIDHNFVVTNLSNTWAPGSNYATAKNGLAAFDYNTYGAASIHDNYVDDTGALFTQVECGGSTANPAVFSSSAVYYGNYDPVTGSAWSGLTNTGNCTP